LVNNKVIICRRGLIFVKMNLLNFISILNQIICKIRISLKLNYKTKIEGLMKIKFNKINLSLLMKEAHQDNKIIKMKINKI
jgi:hypothetical protein